MPIDPEHVYDFTHYLPPTEEHPARPKRPSKKKQKMIELGRDVASISAGLRYRKTQGEEPDDVMRERIRRLPKKPEKRKAGIPDSQPLLFDLEDY